MQPTPPLAATLYVAMGGAIGAACRYQLGRAMTSWLGAPAMSVFPWATLAVNALGSVLMGLLAGWLIKGGENADQLRLLLGVGVLGGFTTFSAFSLEVAMLIERGQLTLASLYVVFSVALGVSGLIFGLAMIRLFS